MAVKNNIMRRRCKKIKNYAAFTAFFTKNLLNIFDVVYTFIVFKRTFI